MLRSLQQVAGVDGGSFVPPKRSGRSSGALAGVLLAIASVALSSCGSGSGDPTGFGGGTLSVRTTELLDGWEREQYSDEPVATGQISTFTVEVRGEAGQAATREFELTVHPACGALEARSPIQRKIGEGPP